ncbi:MAG: long-chain fatty acid--CoA ligase [Desulfobacterales bacterium]|nr:long-chain fatty acid--CoA ligase [Desulfobacterales bacterium]
MYFKDYDSFHEMLRETVDQHPQRQAYRWFDDKGSPTSISWETFYGRMKAVSKSLMALGVERGDKINILSYTCFQWVLTDFAAMSVGVGTVGIYQSNLAVDCEYIINHSDGVLVFAEDQEQLDKLFSVRENIPDIRKVILFNGHSDEDWVISFDEFMELGTHIPDNEFEKRTAQVRPGDLAGIVYTSGTTGIPKGVILSHDNVTYTCQSVYQCAKFYDDDEMFIFLPLAHVFARTCCYTAVKTGSRTTFARSMKTVMDDFALAGPNWFISVPRVFEKIHTKIIAGVEAKGGITQKLFNWACDTGNQVSRYKVEKKEVPWLLALKYKLAFKLIFSKIHKALGGQVRWCISGAAPLNPDIARFFHAADILILEGIGMTENTSFSNVNRPHDYNFGVVGPPGVGVEHSIADDGEVLIKGRNVMEGYYKMPQESADVFTPDGWLKTGDLGSIDENGVLKITGRKKEIIITAGGKNIAPAHVEGILSTSKYINQICVVGDQRKYLVALMSLDMENIHDFAREKGIPLLEEAEMIHHPEIKALMDRVVGEKNKELPSYETIKKIILVPEFTIDNNMMTPTFKLKKNIIIKNYEASIDELYI